LVWQGRLTVRGQLGLPARWFTGDEVYGSLELRRTARTLGFDYALAVKADHRASTAVGRFSATELAAKVPARAWMRRRTGNGTKGDRHYDWALINVLADDAPAGRDEAVLWAGEGRRRKVGENTSPTFTGPSVRAGTPWPSWFSPSWSSAGRPAAHGHAVR
jgi:hypothetical protein